MAKQSSNATTSDVPSSEGNKAGEIHELARELFVKFAQLPEAAQKIPRHYAEQAFVLATEFYTVAGEHNAAGK